jgi:hypothetical protein
VDVPAKGDIVVLYFAGHGSLRNNSKGNKLAVIVKGRPSHADTTLVAADAWTGAHDVTDHDLTRILDQALDKGVKVTAIFDSCHSGSLTRGIDFRPAGVRDRMMAIDPDDMQDGPLLDASGHEIVPPSQRPGNPALIFSAAQQDETAKEKPVTIGNALMVHGVFTLALLQALEDLPAGVPAGDVARQTNAILESEHIPLQTPSMDASAARLRQPLFGGQAEDASKLRATIADLDADG